MKLRRAVRGIVSFVVAITMMMSLISVPAQAAPRPLSLSALGNFGLSTTTAANGDVTLEINMDGDFDRIVMEELVRRANARNPVLSDTVKQNIETYPLGLSQTDTRSWVDFDGTLTTTATGIALTVPGSEVQASATWWQTFLVSAFSILVDLMVSGACFIAVAPASATLLAGACWALGGFVAGMTRGIWLQSIDGKLGDPLSWAKTLAVAVLFATSTGVLGSGVAKFIETKLPVMIRSLALYIRSIDYSGYFAGLKSFYPPAVEMLEGIARFLPDALRAVQGASSPPPLKILPFGDSLTYGIGSSTLSSYRGSLQAGLDKLGRRYEFVGSQNSGTMAQPSNEGHPGWVISQLANIERCTMIRYQPNVVLLHIGTNDINAKNNLSTAPDRLLSLVRSILNDAPGTAVLVGSMMGTTWSAENAANMVAFNARAASLIEAQRKAGGRVAWVDMSAVSTNYMPDGLHPNDAGYAKMATAWNLALAKAGVDDLLSPGDHPGMSPPDDQPGMSPPDQNNCNTMAPAPSLPPRSPSKAEYLHVHDNTATTAYLNGGVPLPLVRGLAGGSSIPWTELGYIASGVVGRVPGGRVQFADLNADDRADYIYVHPDSSVTAYLNGGVASPPVKGPAGGSSISWTEMGYIASGVQGGAPGSQIRFADLNGDGRADYINVHPNSAVTAYLNNGFASPPTKAPAGSSSISWTEMGYIASGVQGGAPASQIRFADINGDGRAEYLNVHPNSAVTAYLNNGFASPPVKAPAGSSSISWAEMGYIASGVVGGAPGSQIHFADLDGG